MMEFIIITLSVFVGTMAAFLMMLALTVNKWAGRKMYKKYMRNVMQIIDEDEGI